MLLLLLQISLKLLINRQLICVCLCSRTYLSYSEDALTAAEAIATKGIPELVETDKNGCSNTFPTLTRQTFSVFYRTMFNELIGCLKAITSTKQSDSREVCHYFFSQLSPNGNLRYIFVAHLHHTFF